MAHRQFSVPPHIDPADFDWVLDQFTPGQQEKCLAQATKMIWDGCPLGPEDALQEGLVQAARNRNKFDPNRGPFIRWFNVTLRNRTIDLCRAHRAEKRRIQKAQLDPTITVTTESIEEPVRHWESPDVQEAFRGLPERSQQVYKLYVAEKMSPHPPENIHRMIAQQHGIGENCSKQIVRRVKMRIQRCLERFPITPPDARFVVVMTYAQSAKAETEKPLSDRLVNAIAEEMSRRTNGDPGILDRLRSDLRLRLTGAKPGEIDTGVIRAILREIDTRFQRLRAGDLSRKETSDVGTDP